MPRLRYVAMPYRSGGMMEFRFLTPTHPNVEAVPPRLFHFSSFGGGDFESLRHGVLPSFRDLPPDELIVRRERLLFLRRRFRSQAETLDGVLTAYCTGRESK